MALGWRWRVSTPAAERKQWSLMCSHKLQLMERTCGLCLLFSQVPFLSTAPSYLCLWPRVLGQWSPTFLAPGTSFMECNFSMDERRWFWDDSSALHLFCTLFLLHQLHLRSAGINSWRLRTPVLDDSRETWNGYHLLLMLPWRWRVMMVKKSLNTGGREGDGTPLQYSCLKNPMDRGA